MTTALSVDPVAQFGEFEAQIGFVPGGNDGASVCDWSRVEALLAESSRVLRAGDTARFNSILAELRKAAASPAKKLEAVDAADWIETDPPPLDPIIEEMFEGTDKVALIGSPKLRKSFLALQLALHVAAGMDFLAWKIPRPRKVLLVQTEMKPAHFHRRVKRMAFNLGVTRAVIESNLQIVNGRGARVDLDEIADMARSFGAQLIILDPLYKLLEGDENSAQDVKPVLAAFDRLAEATGAAVLYVHHDPKGSPGDRNIRDRGAGSNAFSRDYDCCITMTAHRDDPDAVVIAVLQRNFKSHEPFTIGWADGSFRTADLAPVAATSRNAGADPAGRKPAEEYVTAVLELVTKPLTMEQFGDVLTTRMGLTQLKARAVQAAVLADGKLKKTRRSGWGCPAFIGKPADIDRLEASRREQKLAGIDQEALLAGQSRQSC
jgi:hypothetical protein